MYFERMLVSFNEFSTLSILNTLNIYTLLRFDTPIKVDDIVSVKAHFSTNSKCWLVDNEEGFIIIYPDILLTGTSVVGSLFCSRRSILSYVFPGSDPPNIAMVIGSLVHELLQEVSITA